MRMSGTIVIGTTFVDIKGFSKGRYDPRGRNLGTIRIVHGGVGRNVVENFANVGMPVAYVGMLEDSSIGRDVERHLLEIGADLRYAVKAPRDGIGMWMVILDQDGDMAGSISRMPDLSCLEAFLADRGEQIISEADSVVLEVDLNEGIAERVVTLAEAHGKPLYTIVGNMSVVLARRDLLCKTDCFICNEIEAAKFFGEGAVADFSPEQMLLFLPAAARGAGLRSMVVTMGEQGAVWFDGSAAGVCRACPTDVIDTSGAGDAFFSGTVMGLIRGMPLPEAAACGARLASATIGRDETTCPVNKRFFDE